REVRGVAREALSLYGYSVLEARHGEEALAIAAGHAGPIHLLLTDVVMPRLGGRELAALLRGARPELRVLYISGYDRDAAGEADAHFLDKPFSSETLARAVRDALDHA